MGFSAASVAYYAMAASAAAGTGLSIANAVSGPPKAPAVPAPIAQPAPVDQQQLQLQQTFAQQIGQRGRASTVLTNQQDQQKLGS